jgi:hypothetical protein
LVLFLYYLCVYVWCMSKNASFHYIDCRYQDSIFFYLIRSIFFNLHQFFLWIKISYKYSKGWNITCPFCCQLWNCPILH